MISFHPESAPCIETVPPRLVTPGLGMARAASRLFLEGRPDAATRVLATLAILEVSPAGCIEFATEKASMLLEKYFRTAPGVGSSRAPELLLECLNKSASGASAWPVAGMVQHGSDQLIIRITGRENGFFQLLLDERNDEIIAKRLTELGLTPKEAQVLLWIARGKTDAEIATIVGCRPRTVNKHTEHIRAKLGVETRTAAAAVAQELIALCC